MTPKSALKAAIDILGGQSAFARAIGGNVKQGHVYYWLNGGGGKLPAEHCAEIEAATKRKIRKHELRPDVFPPPRTRRKAA